MTDNSLKISVTKPFKFYEEEFSFEEIGKKVFKKRSFNRYAFTGTCIALVGLILTVGGKLGGDKTISMGDITFYVVLSLIIGAVLLITSNNSTNVTLVDKRFIAFFSNQPDKVAVQKFIDLIFSRQKNYMINKYAKRENFISNERLMEQLVWLKDRGIINDEEFKTLKTKLFPDTSNAPQIGFTFNSSGN